MFIVIVSFCTGMAYQNLEMKNVEWRILPKKRKKNGNRCCQCLKTSQINDVQFIIPRIKSGCGNKCLQRTFYEIANWSQISDPDSDFQSGELMYHLKNRDQSREWCTKFRYAVPDTRDKSNRSDKGNLISNLKKNNHLIL